MLCLRDDEQGVVVVTNRLGGMSRHFTITKESFWEWFAHMRLYEPKCMAYTIAKLAKPEICLVPFVDDPEITQIVNMAYGWERTNTPPSWMWPDCDRGAVWGLCNVVWAAKEAWSRMDFKRREVKAKEKH